MTATAGLPLDEQVALLVKGCVTVVRPEDLKAKLVRSRDSGRPLVIKAGFDPSAPDIHLGHTVVMRKMKLFQEMGHEVHFVVGDFTGLIGDPSGKSKTRPQLTKEQVTANAETYRDQACKLLDRDSTRLDYNSSWLGTLGSEGFVRLAARCTVARMIEREDFTTRLAKQQPISLHELLYPLCQAYDSVALKADVELGGTDQTFNLLMGRDVMREYGLEPQVVMTVPLLEGLDGVEKMSKSLGNAIGINEPPSEMFGKAMSISDQMVFRYLTLLTDEAPSAIEDLRSAVAAGARHPMDVKKELAARLVADFHGTAAAALAREQFESVVQRKEAPAAIPEATLPRTGLPKELAALLAERELASSKSDARRLVVQGGVEIDGARVTDPRHAIPADAPASFVVKVGKRGYLKVVVEG